MDCLAHDALGRMTLARRGTAGDPDAVSEVAIAYTDLGDPDFETQRIAAGAARLIDSAYDQAGNRTLLAYPGGETLTFTPTAINQVDAIGLNGQPLLDYRYSGRLLAGRATVTAAPGGAASYDYAVQYDSHRRVSGIANSFAAPGRGVETVAAYAYTHDGNGNPLSQVVTGGLPDFLGDDRVFAVDRLDRLTGTEYIETGAVETSVLDLLGNREEHIDRAGGVTQYGAVNAANEYATIGGTAVSYDAAGNLTVDEDGRQYAYDERNRLTEVRGAAPASAVLATYAYDALGRRIISTIGGVTTHYYYDGQRVIEEREGSSSGTGILPVVNARGGEDRLRFHINGGQFIDERIASFDAAAGEFTYYLLNQNYSVAGMGNADGTVIERLDYSAGGDFGGGGAPPQDYFFDGDGDGDVDLADLESFLGCLTGPGRLGDRDGDGDIDLSDFAAWSACLAGPGVSYVPECGWADLAGVSEANGGGGSGGASPPDGDVDLADFAALTLVFDQPAGPLASACVAFDGDEDGDVDLADFSGFQGCFSGSGQTPAGGCLRPTRGGVEHGRAADGGIASSGYEHGRIADGGIASSGFEHGRMASSSLAGGRHREIASNTLTGGGPHREIANSSLAAGAPARGDAAPSSGTFALHGRPVDVLPDGKTLIWVRARHYDPRHGRWLQRDPIPYTDGPNLYDAFRNNPQRFVDDAGTASTELIADDNWANGATVTYRSKSFWGVATRTVPIGEYYYFEGNRILQSRVAGEVYLLPFAAAEHWARQIEQSRADWNRFVLNNWQYRYDPLTKSYVEPTVSESLAQDFGRFQTQAQADATFVINSAFNPQVLAPGVRNLQIGITGSDPLTENTFKGVERLGVGASGGLEFGMLVVAVRSGLGPRQSSMVEFKPTIGAPMQAGAEFRLPLRVLNAEFTPNATTVLQNLVNARNAALAADLPLAESVLSRPEYLVSQVRPGIARMSYGKSLERLVRDEILDYPLHRQLFDPAGIGGRGPDILGKGPAAGMFFDITTKNPVTVAQHLARPYGQNLIIITYDRPATFVVFP